MQQIPLVNLERLHGELRVDIFQAIERVVDRNDFVLGESVSSFERNFASILGGGEAIGCSNGTASLSLILEALDIGPGDEVVLPSHTFIATAEAISHVGATPILVDVRPDCYTIDVGSVEAVITKKTKAVIPVHLYGTPANMDDLRELAKLHNLFVVEDAAQAHLAEYNGEKVGLLGDAGSFSFFPGKNLGAFGDAGAVTTTDAGIASRVRSLRNHGRSEKYLHSEIGYNHRMDGLQGAVLDVKLKHLADWTERRRVVAGRYDSAFRSAGFKTINPSIKCKSSYHLYVVEVGNRELVSSALSDEGIASGIHYPVPMHKQPALLSKYKVPGSLEVTDRICPRIISLPICGSVSDEEIDHIISVFLRHAEA